MDADPAQPWIEQILEAEISPQADFVEKRFIFEEWDSAFPQVMSPTGNLGKELPYIHHLPITMSHSPYALCKSFLPNSLVPDLHRSSKV